jgi:hypothetical protein
VKGLTVGIFQLIKTGYPADKTFVTTRIYREISFRKEMYSIAESAVWNLGQKAMALIIKTDTFIR